MFFIFNNKKYLTHKTLNHVISVFSEEIKNAKPLLFSNAVNHAISLNFVNDREIQILNTTYRNKDKPTDVLSWGFLLSPLHTNEIAGEIYISVDTLKRQARAKRKSIPNELIFLIVHALLHIFEYDHQTDEQEAEMDLLTDRVISKLCIDYL